MGSKWTPTERALYVGPNDSKLTLVNKNDVWGNLIKYILKTIYGPKKRRIKGKVLLEGKEIKRQE